jgi:ankyrin repeat protein
MRLALRPTAGLALLIPLTSAGCDDAPPGASDAPGAGGAAGSAAGAEAAAELEKPAPLPGEKGYVAPPTSTAPPAIVKAAQKGNVDAVRSLLESDVDPDAAHQGLTALHIAVGQGQTEMVELLLEKGANVDARQQAQATPLHIAASTGNEAIVRLLLAREPEVNAQDHKGRTPLMAAASNGHTEIVHQLLDAGADANLADEAGATALIQAILFADTELVAALLARGADVNAADKKKYVPLHYAAEKCDRAMVELLVANGADVLAKTVEGGTAFQLAAVKECTELVPYMQELERTAGGAASTEPLVPQKPPLEPK